MLAWPLKFFVPPLVGAVFLALAYTIFTFDTVLWGYATLFENIRIVITLLAGTIVTFYVYYTLAYVVFFIYLIILQKIGKLSLSLAMISGFLYGLIPLMFDHNTWLSIWISLAVGISGAVCAGCYYYLDRRLKATNNNRLLY